MEQPLPHNDVPLQVQGLVIESQAVIDACQAPASPHASVLPSLDCPAASTSSSASFESALPAQQPPVRVLKSVLKKRDPSVHEERQEPKAVRFSDDVSIRFFKLRVGERTWHHSSSSSKRKRMRKSSKQEEGDVIEDGWTPPPTHLGCWMTPYFDMRDHLPTQEEEDEARKTFQAIPLPYYPLSCPRAP